MLVKVKWGNETYTGVEVDTNEAPHLFKAQLYALTNVPPDRQKVVIAGKRLGESWDGVKLKAGMVVMLMGTADPLPEEPIKQTKFLEDMSAEELGLMNVKVPSGLQNLGNTCYLNSVVQVLHHITPLQQAAQAFNKSSDPHAKLASSLGQVFRQITIAGGSAFSPLTFLSDLYAVFPDFSETKEDSMVPMQQDAEECFSRLLNVLDGQLPGSKVRQLFGLELRVEYRCGEAEEVSTVNETSFKLPCHINKDVGFLMSGVSQCLEETITKNSAVLGREAVFVKRQRIARLPKYLTVQLVRFFWKPGVGNKPGNRAKIVKPIQFPDVLDLFDLCDGSLQTKLKAVRARMEHEEEKKLGLAKAKESSKDEKESTDDKGSAALEPLPEFGPNDNETGKYRLCAIITHEGYSAEGGHYTAWVRSSDSEKADWYWFDDAKVTLQTAETVKALARSTGDAPIPYLLMYSSVPSSLTAGSGQAGPAGEDVVMQDAK
jgi:ubiquitin carboxyl-terminal hydrolase 14